MPIPNARRRQPALLLAWLLVLLPLGGCSLLRFGRSGDFTQSPYFGASPPPWQAPRELRVVTFNIKDMYWLSDHRAERVMAIGEALADLAPDVVCLQEGFVAGDVAVIAGALRAIGVEHAVDFPSGAVGSGMWTFSRFPIRERWFRKFSRNGAFYDTAGGDWWAGKGVGLARLEVGPGELLDVYNAHLICGLGPPDLVAHRHVQVRELAAFVSGATPANVPALVLGDFNTGPGSDEFGYLDYALRWQRLLRRDTWLDHVYAYALFDGYRFTPLEEAPIQGRAPVAGSDGDTVGLSDHTGWLVRLEVAPASPAGDPAGGDGR